MTNYFIAGSAHLDIIAESKQFKDTLDKPGVLRIDFGGTAANVAVNLVNKGNEVCFCTAMNSSAISNVILEELRKESVNVYPYFNDYLPESGFSAHLNDGDMYSAVASIAVENHTFKVDEFLSDKIAHSDYVILDCNLNEASLLAFSNQARQHNKKLVYLMVSEGKGLKITSLPIPDFAFCNRREYQYLQMNSSYTPDEKTTFIVTNGSKGATAFNGAVRTSQVQAIEVKKHNNFVGAGDSFAAGFLHTSANNKDIDSAMTAGAILASQVIEKDHSHHGRGNSLNRQISHLEDSAYQDKLTGLLNRSGSERVINEFKRENTPFSILFFDIDHFKKINDTFGHDIGDQALVHLARLLKRAVGEEDYPVRLGGEEFIVITKVNIGLARSMAERIRKHIEQFGAVGPIEKMTVSVGLSACSDAANFEKSLKAADQALYDAKNNGRNCVVLA